VIAETRGIQAYKQVQTESRSPLELVVMLYDGALAALAQATDAADRQDLRQRGRAISQALAIIGTLQENLNVVEGGAVAQELDRLYAYAIGRLVDVTVKHDRSAISEIQKLLSGLRDAWQQIATSPSPLTA
jgi:flagellar secretion chaperone FliS